MVPVQFLIALAAAYDGMLYVLQAPNSISAFITCDHNTNNVTWHKMENSVLAEIPVFKIAARNFTDNGLLTFKIKFHSPTYSVTSNWQTIMLGEEKSSVLKTFIEPTNSYCCISSAILGTTLLLVTALCIAYFFIYWSINFNNLR